MGWCLDNVLDDTLNFSKKNLYSATWTSLPQNMNTNTEIKNTEATMSCFNPSTPKIWKLILLTEDHTFLSWLFLSILFYIKPNPPDKDNLYTDLSWESKG